MPVSHTPNSEWEAPVITGGTPATPARMNNLEDGLSAVVDAYNALEAGDTTIGAATPSDGDVLTFDTVTGWGAAAPTGSGGGASDLDDLTDVDVSTTPPTDGQSLVFDTADNLWKPATVSGGGGGAVDSVNGQTGTVVLDQDAVADGTTYKQYSATEKTKLSGVATGATANDTDANLKNRANHTGTQTASTISDFNTAADARVELVRGLYVGINAQTGTTYAPVLTDQGKLVTLTNAGAITVTLPQNTDLAFPVGASIDFLVKGAGQASFVAGTGATKIPTGTLTTRLTGAFVTVVKVDTNEWALAGDFA